MSELKFTLITDGSSDRTLMNIIKWLLDDLYPKLPNKGAYADFRHLSKPPKSNDIKGRIKFAGDYYPYDILIYHRDAESTANNIIETRVKEVFDHLEAPLTENTVCIVPITMMESWLLFNEEAIKRASGNRNYNGQITLPQLAKIEEHKDPKTCLHDLLKLASGLKSRNLKKFNVHSAVHLVAENIEDFSPLKQLSSFQKFEQDLKKVVDSILAKAD